jgi:hypothetical protein
MSYSPATTSSGPSIRSRSTWILSEIADEAQAISALIESDDFASAGALMSILLGKMAHLSSHWRSLARLTECTEVYDEIDKTYSPVNGDSQPGWHRCRLRRL